MIYSGSAIKTYADMFFATFLEDTAHLLFHTEPERPISAICKVGPANEEARNTMSLNKYPLPYEAEE